MRKNLLLCHIMQENKEVGISKTKIYSQEFQWKKRMWAIPHDKSDNAIIHDRKGIAHLYVDVNESDGIIRLLEPTKSNIVDNTCTKCGGKISIDARNVWDLLKRKTITTFWGIDNSFTLLLIIMGIMAVGALGALFYFIGENQTLQTQLQLLQQRLTVVK